MAFLSLLLHGNDFPPLASSEFTVVQSRGVNNDRILGMLNQKWCPYAYDVGLDLENTLRNLSSEEGFELYLIRVIDSSE